MIEVYLLLYLFTQNGPKK